MVQSKICVTISPCCAERERERLELDLVPFDFYNTIQRHHLDFVKTPYVYYLCCR